MNTCKLVYCDFCAGPGVNSSTILKVASKKIHQKFNFFEMTLQIEEFQEQMANCKQCQDPLS